MWHRLSVDTEDVTRRRHPVPVTTRALYEGRIFYPPPPPPRWWWDLSPLPPSR